jgi:Spy/CpxP family protein refolding chaperone
MNFNWIRIAAVPAVAAGMLLAQQAEPSNQEGRKMTHGRHGRHNMAGRLAQHLNLTEAQKAQAKSFFQEAQREAQPLAAELKQIRQAVHEAAKSGNQAEIDRLSARQGVVLGQMAAIRTKAMSKVYATLTPEQREKADQLQEKMKNRFQGRSVPRG